MKKLLVAAMGVAVAFGASADLLNAQRFEGMTQTSTDVAALNTQAGGTYWAELWATNNPPEVTNAYEITAYDGKSQVGLTVPDYFAEAAQPDNALNIKTKFNYPLSFNAVTGGTPTNINDGIYFDSLVKFTVCDSAPEQDYSGAKIVMWLQEDEDLHKTNLVVKAGSLSVGVNGIEVSGTVYTCGNVIGSDFADKWHRVTIKSIANITQSDLRVPGFVIYIDGAKANASDEAKWDSSFTEAHTLTYAASEFNKDGALFPSLVQGANGTVGKDTLTSVAFDGTGWLNDLVFTDTAPDFAEDPVEPIINTMTVKIGDAEPVEVTDFAAAVALASEQTSGTAVTIKPLMDVTLTAPVVISGEADIVLDFAGYVITNTMADAVITNSANLVITNSSVTLGGIYCLNNPATDGALAAVGGTTTINAGMFNGLIITPATGLAINGGYFKQTYNNLKQYLAKGKTLKYDGATGLNKVQDIVYYTVTFDADGGEWTGDESLDIEEGGIVDNPGVEPTKDNYSFVMWRYNNGEEMVEFIFDGDPGEREATAVTGDITLVAQWEAVVPPTPEYTVTFRTNGVEFATQNVTSNSTASAPSPAPTAATGYTFGGWYEGDSAYDFDTPVTGNLTLDAKYTANTYTVTFYTNSVVYTTANYTYGDSSTYSAPADPSVDGYTFGGWYTDDGEFKITFVFDENVADNTQVAYAKLTGLSPVTPVVPGEDITPPEGTTAAQYADDINTAIAGGKGADYITVPTEAASTSASYLGLLKAQVNGDKIDIVFNEEATGYAAVTNAIETVAIPAVGAALPDVAAGKAASTSNVSIASGLTPGLYYSISYCTDLADFDTVDEDEGTRVKADASGAATLTTPEKKSATQGFYRVNVNVSE